MSVSARFMTTVFLVFSGIGLLVVWCNTNSAIVRHANGTYEGASDPRSDGAALGF